VHRSRPRPGSLLRRCCLYLLLLAVLTFNSIIFIANCPDMTSSWLETTQFDVILYGRTFRIALILLLTT
jgi:hypothetical protein